MGRSYGDELRRKFLLGCDAGESSLKDNNKFIK